MGDAWRGVLDLAVLFVFLAGLAKFRTPQAARYGTLMIAAALLAGLAVEVVRAPSRSPALAIAAFTLGGAGGWLGAAKVNMTQVPAMVGFQNGAGGLAAMLVSLVELLRLSDGAPGIRTAAAGLAVVVGAVTFSGSMVASARLARVFRQRPIVLPWPRLWVGGASLALLALLLAGASASGAARGWLLAAGAALGLIVGTGIALPVGGADMPVLISLLNAFSGLAAAFCGIVVANRLLIACGATVAASGFVLTHAMCRAMNRNLVTVLAGSTVARQTPSPPECIEAIPPVGGDGPRARRDGEDDQTSFARAVAAIRAAAKVILIPGYGMALAHAQAETVQLGNRLAQRGKQVKFAVHPIAGRMPGHMHVLLAEAEVDPSTLFDLDEINTEFATADVALIVGACDVVNPAAIHVEGTPISGMPILAAHEAATVVVCNLDASPGYSGVPNPLYENPKTILLLGDAKASLRRLLESV